MLVLSWAAVVKGLSLLTLRAAMMLQPTWQLCLLALLVREAFGGKRELQSEKDNSAKIPSKHGEFLLPVNLI